MVDVAVSDMTSRLADPLRCTDHGHAVMWFVCVGC